MAIGVLLPLLALRGIGNLISRRRAMRGSAFGKAMNTQPQGPPTNPVSQAATQNPTPPGTPQPSSVQDDSGLGAQLGAASIERSRKKNKSQQAALSGQALV